MNSISSAVLPPSLMVVCHLQGLFLAFQQSCTFIHLTCNVAASASPRRHILWPGRTILYSWSPIQPFILVHCTHSFIHSSNTNKLCQIWPYLGYTVFWQRRCTQEDSVWPGRSRNQPGAFNLQAVEAFVAAVDLGISWQNRAMRSNVILCSMVRSETKAHQILTPPHTKTTGMATDGALVVVERALNRSGPVNQPPKNEGGSGAQFYICWTPHRSNWRWKGHILDCSIYQIRYSVTVSFPSPPRAKYFSKRIHGLHFK